MENSSIEIGLRIKKYRKAAKLSQTELAEKLDKTLRTVQKYESGEIQPSIAIINEIAKILNVSPADLAGYEKESIHLNSVSDILLFIHELGRKADLNFDIEVHRPPNYDEWTCSIKFNGNESDAKYNASLCLLLERYRNIRSEYTSYMIDDESFDMWVDKELASHSDSRLIDKEPEKLTDEERIKKMLEMDQENMKKIIAAQKGDE